MAPHESLRSDHEGDYICKNYDALKKEVIKQLEAPCLAQWEDVMKYFLRDIGSPRTLSKLKNSPDLRVLLRILEHLDCLSPDNADVLIHLARIVRCSCVIVIVNQYKIQNSINSETSNVTCKICGQIIAESQQHVTTSEDYRFITPLQSSDQQESQGLDVAVEKICRRLGRSWRDLARTKELGFTDYDIDGLMEDNKRMADQIAGMFREWQEREGTRATVPKLIKALKKARRKDLADLLADSR